MFKLISLALVALAAVSTVNAVAIFPRKTPPTGWIAEILEPYDDYNTRYTAIGCQNKHNTQFFDDCCHPMKKGETLENNRKPYCRPGSSPVPSSTPATVSPHVKTLGVEPTSTSSPVPQPSPVPDNGDDNDDNNDDGDDEDCEDEPDHTPVPSSSHTPEPTPDASPSPSPAKPSPVEKPTSTSTKVPSEPTPSPTPVQNPSSETHTGGHVTWFTQKGNAGACGVTHSDNDFIAALDYRVYGDLGAKSKYCGDKIRVSWQGKSVDVTVADACPTCDNSASVDLSLAAFKALAPLDVGLLTGVTWELL